MAGVVLETLSWKKLSILISFVLVGQIICFLIGGLISPSPFSYTNVLTEKCVDSDNNTSKWFHSRKVGGKATCTNVLSDEAIGRFDNKHHVPIGVDVVFTAHIPLRRDGISLNMSRWFQQLIGVLNIDIKHTPEIQLKENSILTMDVRLGYRNKGSDGWTELARSDEVRPLKCKLDDEAIEKAKRGYQIDGYFYDCDVLPLFSLGSCHYDEYLINIRLPFDRKTNKNTNIGILKDIWVVEIHQNGGFTMVWFALKTFMFPLTLSALIFFWHRINLLERKSNLLEQTIIALGIFMSLLNFPIEWLSLKINLSFWLVLSDIRQGAFYAMLLCFWIIFTGEHMLDDSQIASYANPKDKLFHYWPQLVPIGAASCFLFLFEIAERGVQLKNPFYSVWSHQSTAYIAVAFVILACICAPTYFIFLFYKIVVVTRQMLGKRSVLPSLPEVRRKFYSGVIYRFTIFIIYTLVCATLTVIFFIMSQIDESKWKWGDKMLEYTSAFITGVYGMWNFYVILILCLYAPSHKFRNETSTTDTDNLLSATGNNSEDVVVRCYSEDSTNASGKFNNISIKKRQSKPSKTEATTTHHQLNTISRDPNTQPNSLDTLVFLNKSSRF